jgi:uncharacterized lipoprotein YajG
VAFRCNLVILSFMLAQAPRRTISFLLLLASCVAFVGCATEKNVALVNDPDAKKESQIPWNKQEKWETQQSQFTGMTDHR